MATEQVKTIHQLKIRNAAHWNRVRRMEEDLLTQLADINHKQSVKIAETVKYQGVLMSSIKNRMINKTVVQVLSDAPHSRAIEEGVHPIVGSTGGYVYFSESPGLEGWVRTKLLASSDDEVREKGKYFIRIKAVRVGVDGFPHGLSDGLRFMELGLEFAYASSNQLLSQQLLRLA